MTRCRMATPSPRNTAKADDSDARRATNCIPTAPSNSACWSACKKSPKRQPASPLDVRHGAGKARGGTSSQDPSVLTNRRRAASHDQPRGASFARSEGQGTRSTREGRREGVAGGSEERFGGGWRASHDSKLSSSSTAPAHPRMAARIAKRFRRFPRRFDEQMSITSSEHVTPSRHDASGDASTLPCQLHTVQVVPFVYPMRTSTW
mmetsp:Transcript_4401/g.28065  ORF Transcript_4401/g.28065 Transcript_4401/m.28065 type:complete len:206 (+) Transcript_4401:2905-3522(+)